MKKLLLAIVTTYVMFFLTACDKPTSPMPVATPVKEIKLTDEQKRKQMENLNRFSPITPSDPSRFANEH